MLPDGQHLEKPWSLLINVSLKIKYAPANNQPLRRLESGAKNIEAPQLLLMVSLSAVQTEFHFDYSFVLCYDKYSTDLRFSENYFFGEIFIKQHFRR